MLFINMEDFFAQVSTFSKLSREEEKALACKMAEGDPVARDALVQGYLPLVASYIRRMPEKLQTLHALYDCIATLEKAVDRFNFLQDSETFAHHLSWGLRQCITRCIADRP